VCANQQLFINLGAYLYMTPAGCADETVSYFLVFCLFWAAVRGQRGEEEGERGGKGMREGMCADVSCQIHFYNGATAVS
jgi:hypothetical protein